MTFRDRSIRLTLVKLPGSHVQSCTRAQHSGAKAATYNSSHTFPPGEQNLGAGVLWSKTWTVVR